MVHGYSVEDGTAPAALETCGLFLLATMTAGGEGMVITVSVARIILTGEMFLTHGQSHPIGNTALV